MPIRPTFREERALVAEGFALVAGVDEAGRGPLAGPVCAAAVILPQRWIKSARRKSSKGRRDPRVLLRDSKALSAPQRDLIYAEVLGSAMAYGVSYASVDTIDTVGIAHATRRAMVDAVAALSRQPDAVLIDGSDDPGIALHCQTIIDGDALCGSIAAASIVAKVSRDRVMVEMDSVYPGYGFARNKGYGTKGHLQSLKRLGPTPIHRRSFAPVRDMLIKPRLL